MWGRWLAVLAALAATGCLESSAVVCADGRLCPAGTVCSQTHDLCLEPQQVGACTEQSLAELATCTIGEIDGFCMGGDCLRHDCGDGLVTGNERCDPDDPATRTTTCELLDYYAGDQATCTSDCRYDDDTSCAEFCGDELVNGPEVCDGAPPAESCVDSGFDRGFLDCSNRTCAPNTGGCGFFGWRTMSSGTLGHIRDLDQVDGVGFAVAEGATSDEGSLILRFSDGRWTPLGELSPQVNLKAVYAESVDSVFVAGERWDPVAEQHKSTIWSWDGTDWTEELFTAGLAIVSLDGADGAIFAVSDATSWVRTGGTWTEATFSSAGFGTADVWARSAGEAYFVQANVLWRWDGANWSDVGDLPSTDLVAVQGNAPGGLVLLSPGEVFVSNGASWTPLGYPGSNGYALHVVSATDIRVFELDTPALVLRYDGQKWRSLGQVAVGQDAGALAAIGPAIEDAVMTGQLGLIQRFAGSNIEVQDLATGAPLTFSLAQGALFAATTSRYVERWYQGEVETSFQMNEPIHAIWASAPDDAWLVSRTTDVAPSKLHHYDGVWSILDAPVYTSSTALNAIAGSHADDVVAVGQQGLIVHFNGSSWTELVAPSEQSADLIDVHCLADGECMALGYNGTVVRRTARSASFETIAALPDDVAHTLLGTSSGAWYAGTSGPTGGIWQLDGQSWSLLRQAEVRDISGDDDDLFLVTNLGLLHYDGGHFNPVRTTSPVRFSVASLSTVYFAALTGELFTLERFDEW